MNKKTNHFSFILALLLVSAVSVNSSPYATKELSHLFNSKLDFWELSGNAFMRIEAQNGFRWNSMHQQTSSQSTDPELLFLGMPVIEANAYFTDKAIHKLVLSLYNRGDSGQLSKEEFKNLLKSVQNKISKWTKQPYLFKDKEQQTNYIQNFLLSWRHGQTRIDLEWSGTKKRKVQHTILPYRAEYIRVTFTPFTRKSSLNSATAPSKKKKRISFNQINSRVQHSPDGDVFLKGIPMVNQDNKNYCSVATASRVMGYYGQDIDQHELAQMVDTSYLGTDPKVMVEALKRLAFKLGVRIRVHEEFEAKKFIQLIDTYNKSRPVRTRKLDKIDYQQIINVNQVFREMNTELLREIRTKKSADKIQFKRKVTKHIDVGIPVIWSVILGKVQENPRPPQEVGGHTRLIIGYNMQTNQIIYTDSWGSGHDFKRLSFDDALTITMGLFTIEPRSRRN